MQHRLHQTEMVRLRCERSPRLARLAVRETVRVRLAGRPSSRGQKHPQCLALSRPHLPQILQRVHGSHRLHHQPKTASAAAARLCRQTAVPAEAGTISWPRRDRDQQQASLVRSAPYYRCLSHTRHPPANLPCSSCARKRSPCKRVYRRLQSPVPKTWSAECRWSQMAARCLMPVAQRVQIGRRCRRTLR